MTDEHGVDKPKLVDDGTEHGRVALDAHAPLRIRHPRKPGQVKRVHGPEFAEARREVLVVVRGDADTGDEHKRAVPIGADG